MINATEIDTSRLEDLLGGECKCESSHKDISCSGQVVARKYTKCFPAFNICANSRNWNLDVMSSGAKCSFCQKLAKDCWTIIPV